MDQDASNTNPTINIQSSPNQTPPQTAQPIQPQVPTQTVAVQPAFTPPAQPEKQTSSWAVIGLLITFPPAAWILMWKAKKFHSWFHKILFIYGIMGILEVVDLYFSIPDINKTYHTLGLSSPSNLTMINELNALFSALQIVYALYLWLKLRNKDISIIDVVLSGIIISVPFVIILYLSMLAFLTPVYNISSQIPQYSPQTVNGQLTIP